MNRNKSLKLIGSKIDLNSLLILQRLENPSAHAVELQNVSVKLPKCRTMGDGKERNSHVLGRLVDWAFNIDRHGWRALVEQRILRSVEEWKLVRNYKFSGAVSQSYLW